MFREISYHVTPPGNHSGAIKIELHRAESEFQFPSLSAFFLDEDLGELVFVSLA
jgi:hypothetical protein